MKVRMKTLLTGSVNGVRWPAPGETVEVDDQVGADVCSNGYAEPVASKPSDRTEKRAGKVQCGEDGCDYEGTSRGLKIHAGQVHG